MMENMEDMILNAMGADELPPADEDYTGEDGLLYCGKCHTPKQFRMDKAPFEGRLLYHRCQCEQERYAKEEAQRKQEKHLQTVSDLKRRGFTNPEMVNWNFVNDNGQTPQMNYARTYVAEWEHMKAQNIGYLLWGKCDSGKSYLAGCIANALMEQEVSVLMTNFPLILNDLASTFEGRNDYISRLCCYPLLIIDDLGAERGTEYGLEQVYHVIDNRYRSHKPLIVTTNLTLEELQQPQDTAHARIYSRVIEMCVPVLCTGRQNRKHTAQKKMEFLKQLMNNERSNAYD